MATHCSILSGESRGQKSLASYSAQRCKESDTTEATQHEQLKTTNTYSYAVLQARNPKLLCWQGHDSSGGSREEFLLASCSFWWRLAILAPLACDSMSLISAFIFTWPTSLHVCVFTLSYLCGGLCSDFSLLINTPIIGLRLTLMQYDLILT